MHALGCVALVAYASMTALSFVQAAALWRHEAAPRTQAFFDALSAQLHPLLPSVSGWLLGSRPFETALVDASSPTGSRLRSRARPCSRSSCRCCSRPRSQRAQACRSCSCNGPTPLPAVCTLAFPVFTQDLWLSAAWGRMIAAGVNPFHTLFTPELLAGLPLDHFPMPMSYGPLWGLVSGGIMLIAGDSVLARRPCCSRR